MTGFNNCLCTAVLALATLLQAPDLRAQLTVSATPQAGSFPIVDNEGRTAAFVVDAGDAQVVATAAEMVCGDIELVTGRRPEIKPTPQGEAFTVIAGTVGRSALVDMLAASGKIAVAGIKGKWEAFGIEIIDNPADGVESALVAYGSTPRGTAYALLELSRLMGVSPFVWWADVMPEKRDALYAAGDRMLAGEPSVKYRGIFINDEDWGLQPWAKKNIDSRYGNIGPNTYAKVMELLLRLRANTLWPAMHPCSEAFWANKDNLPVARKYDIVLGSSHCEQMLRNNVWEWHSYNNNSGTNENWNYTTNKDVIRRYWEERVEESKGYSAMYTIGMRGVHDWGISGYPSVEDKVRGLTEIIAFQRSLLEKHIGDPATVPQTFIPYKEVLEAYNAGLELPDDVTLTWVDDNHGYIRQLPTPAEQARSGGNGLYYHLSYWGAPADYLWLSSISPSLASFELTKAYENGIRNLWIINVGDIKPAEAEIEFCMDLAWNVDEWGPEKAHDYSRHWAARTFGEEFADEIGRIKAEYYALAAEGKPEHIHAVDYTDSRIDERISRYKAIADAAAELAGHVPARLADAYFQLVEYPVTGAYYMNVKTLRARQSLTLAKAGVRDLALAYAADARKAYRMIDDISAKYNTGIAGGKWNGIMNCRPRNQAQFGMPETATASGIANYAVEQAPEESVTIGAGEYEASSGRIKVLEGLGAGGCGAAVWPIDYKSYSPEDAGKAPYVQYRVPVRKGANKIEAQFLPTFPVHAGQSLNVALSVNDAPPAAYSIKTVATEGKWNTTVLQGYNEASLTHTADEDGSVSLRVYLLDPGIVVSRIVNSLPPDGDGGLTGRLLVNADFEYDTDGNHNSSGQTVRGIPYGWISSGTLKGNSFGVNNDGKNFHGNNLCWINSTPMPEDYELSQTVSAEKLSPGFYLVRCLLWVQEGLLSNCRLFANNNVQYFGSENDYAANLTAGEDNTFAGYHGGKANNFDLREMSVIVKLAEGEDLKVGIRSGSRLANGATATNNSGWFKVDHFRIDRITGDPTATEEDLTLTRELLANHDFELYEYDGEVIANTSGVERRGVPYGWSVSNNVAGDSYGINNDMKNQHGTNGCWFFAKGGRMSDDFELYQQIPAGKLTPGRYAVSCRLWQEDGHFGKCRLFANNSVQYYGMDIDYDLNLTPGEETAFAGYVGTAAKTYALNDMCVYVDVAPGDDLRVGIRSGNMRADGKPGAERGGWFKADYFRIHKLSTSGAEPLLQEEGSRTYPVFNLFGQIVAKDSQYFSRLPKGIYISRGRKIFKTR